MTGILANSTSNGTISGDSNILVKNCRSEWPDGLCIFFNICGLTSTCVWFIVLFPQVWKNFRRKSVRGLSVLWATANFTASLINLFFVFYFGKLPLYSKVAAVYMPVMELTLLIQFLAFGTHPLRNKLLYCFACVFIWAALIITELVTDWYMDIEWVAIVLWSIETFPQVMLNMKLGSTGGQSTASVCLAVLGKICDFLSTYGLVMPLQSVIMTYFSSTLGCFNGLQVAWYKPKEAISEQVDSTDEFDIAPDDIIAERHGTGTDEVPDRNRREMRGSVNLVGQFQETVISEILDEQNNGILDDDEQATDKCSDPLLSEKSISVTSPYPAPRFDTKTVKQLLRWPALVFLSVLLLFYAAGLVWNTNSYLSLMGPIGIVLILSIYWFHTRIAFIYSLMLL